MATVATAIGTLVVISIGSTLFGVFMNVTATRYLRAADPGLLSRDRTTDPGHRRELRS